MHDQHDQASLAAHAQQAALVEAEHALRVKRLSVEEAERLRATVDALAIPDATP